jgi:hypothetical protein
MLIINNLEKPTGTQHAYVMEPYVETNILGINLSKGDCLIGGLARRNSASK